MAAVFAVVLSSCGDDNGANSGGGGANATVTIGGVKWMKKNLNVKTEGSWCYDGKDANCDKYGRLYTYSAADAACSSIGMFLPGDKELDALVTAAGGAGVAGKKLKSKSGWDNNNNGTDNYGFSALPGGYRDNGYFKGVGKTGYWWKDKGAYSATKGWILEGDGLGGEAGFSAGDGLSVRCWKY